MAVTGAELQICILRSANADGLVAVVRCLAGPVAIGKRFQHVIASPDRSVDLTLKSIQRPGGFNEAVPRGHTALVVLHGSGAPGLEVDQILKGRIAGPYSTVEEILSYTGAASDALPVLAADGHARFACYTSLLERISPGAENELALTAAILGDPDEAMGQAVLVGHLARRAWELSSSAAYRAWRLSVGEVIMQTSFLWNRASEWESFWCWCEGQPIAAFELRTMSDWLQRRLADHTDQMHVLALLAEHGRTKRVRHTAAARLDQAAR